MEPQKIWKDQCKAARDIELEFGTQPALKYLIEEKFVNFLDAAQVSPVWAVEIPDFVAEIKTLFETWQLKQCLETALERPPIQETDFVGMDAEEIESERQADIRRCSAELLLIERAKEWLLNDNNST